MHTMRSALLRQIVLGALALLTGAGIVASVTVTSPPAPTEPPAAPLSEEQRRFLERWLTLEEPVFLAPPEGNRTLPPLPRAFQHPSLILYTPRGRAFLEDLTEHLRSEVALAIEALLREELRKHFGEGLSPKHDLLPLLTGSVTLEIALTDPPTFLLAGEAENPATMQKRLRNLHAIVARAWNSIEERRRTFPEGWQLHDLRADPSGVRAEERSLGLWTIRATLHAQSSTALLTASLGKAFLVSNDASAVDAYLHAWHGYETLPAQSDGSTVAAGLIDADVAEPILALLAPAGAEQSALFGIYRWSAARADQRITITVTR